MEFILFVAAALLVLWIVVKVFFKSVGCIIHLALIAAVILAVFWLLREVFQPVLDSARIQLDMDR